MKSVQIYLLAASAALTLLGGAAVLAAQQTKSHKVVVELNVAGPEQWEAVLRNVENVRKAFAPESTEIEVVAHGGGIGALLRSSNPVAAKVAELSSAGVKFAACENTMRRKKIDKADLVPSATTVDSGVAEVVRKQEAGWAYLKGGE